MNTQQLGDITNILKDAPLAATCAVLILFVIGLASYIVYLQRSNAKAEKEDTEVKHLLAGVITQLSSRIGRVMKALEHEGYDIPANADDDDETLLLTDMLEKKSKGR